MDPLKEMNITAEILRNLFVLLFLFLIQQDYKFYTFITQTNSSLHMRSKYDEQTIKKNKRISF